MTDEEKAEEHAKRYKIDLCAYCRECEEGSCSHTDDAVFGYKDGFKAGLKAGRPKWHKVADGDLPEYRYYVLVSRGTRTDKALYNKYEKKWYSYYDDELDNVTAWCEIPKYEE